MCVYIYSFFFLHSLLPTKLPLLILMRSSGGGTKLLQQEKAALLLPPIAPEGAEWRVGKGTAGPRRSIPLRWANDSSSA